MFKKIINKKYLLKIFENLIKILFIKYYSYLNRTYFRKEDFY